MKTQKELQSSYEKRKKWFMERIGKRIFRAPVTCQCESCVRGHVEGIVIMDKDHAAYLQDCEAELRIRYSDKRLPS